MKLLKTSDQEKNLKTAEEKNITCLQMNKNKDNYRFLIRNNQVGDNEQYF